MKKLRYPLLIILSAIMYGIMPALTKLTYDHGGNGMTMTFFTPLFALPFLFLLAKREKQSLKVSLPQFKKIAVMNLCGGSLAMMLLFFSYEFLPVGMSTTLHFIYPMVVAVAMVVFFKEKLNLLKVAALVAAVAGIAVMSLEEVNLNVFGMVLALLSGFAYAFVIVYMDKSGLKDMNSYVLGVYSACFTSAIAGVVGLATGKIGLLTSPKAWGIAVLVSICSRVIAGPCFQMGLRGTGPLAAGILSTFEPIFSVLIGIVLLGEAATISKIAGCFFVVLGVCLIVYSDVQQAKKDASVKETV